LVVTSTAPMMNAARKLPVTTKLHAPVNVVPTIL
jgi:hypothetical protein